MWIRPSERGDSVEALMGEASWYDDKFGIYVEVWGPETFTAPKNWRTRAKQFHFDSLPDVNVVVPHPHDVVFAKLARLDPKDTVHIEQILDQMKLSMEDFETLKSELEGSSAEPIHSNLAWLRSRLD